MPSAAFMPTWVISQRVRCANVRFTPESGLTEVGLLSA